MVRFISPGGAVAGALMFPASGGVGGLPLKLVVEANGKKFEFVTKSN